MKKLVALFCFLSLSLFAQAEGKIAVVNFEQAIFNTDVAQQKFKEMEAEADYKASMEEAKKIQEEGTALTEKYKKEEPIMSPQQKLELQSRIQSKQKDLEHVGGKIQEAKQKVMSGLVYVMKIHAMKAAKEIVDAEGIGLLLNATPQTVYHADTSFDITAKVTDKLNKLKQQ